MPRVIRRFVEHLIEPGGEVRHQVVSVVQADDGTEQWVHGYVESEPEQPAAGRAGHKRSRRNVPADTEVQQ